MYILCWRITSTMLSYNYKKRAGRTALPLYMFQNAPLLVQGERSISISRFAFYLPWNRATTITINWHSAITHINTSNVIIRHSPFHIQGQNRSAAIHPNVLAALRYMYYHKIPWLYIDLHVNTGTITFIWVVITFDMCYNVIINRISWHGNKKPSVDGEIYPRVFSWF